MVTIEQIKKLAIEEKKYKSGFKKSGLLLEKYVQQKISNLKKQPPCSEFDFKYNHIFLDIKGCWASDYNGNIFIESIQNTNIDSIPSHVKNPTCMFIYVDYNTGEMFLINWPKLYTDIKDSSVVNGGYNAKGWIININTLITNKLCVKL
jgi:hypothetical protein